MVNNSVIALIAQIREKANRLIIQELAKDGVRNIATSHGNILNDLFEYKELSMNQLSMGIDKTKSTVTVLVDKLVLLGYVVKKKSSIDSRVTLVRLTKKGENFKPIFQRISKKLLLEAYKGFSEKEKEVLISLLSRMGKNI